MLPRPPRLSAGEQVRTAIATHAGMGVILWRGLTTVLWLCGSAIVLLITLGGSALILLAAQLMPLVSWLARQGDGE